MATVAIGDIHGQVKPLCDLLERVRPNIGAGDTVVFLGDYIDRGLFSYNGVLRAVMQVFAAAPRYVVMLRGNHEYYLEHQGEIYGGVRPAEAINSMAGLLPVDVFSRFLDFFDAMPNMLLFDQLLLSLIHI